MIKRWMFYFKSIIIVLRMCFTDGKDPSSLQWFEAAQRANGYFKYVNFSYTCCILEVGLMFSFSLVRYKVVISLNLI